MSRGYFDDWVGDSPLHVVFQVLAVGWVDHREAKGGGDSIDCAWLKPALDGELIDGARDCQLAVVRWPHLDQWD